MSNRNKIKPPESSQIIAVVGLGLSLPGASTVEEFWANIISGHRFFQAASSMDWGADPENFYQTGSPAPDKAYSLNGVFNHKRSINPTGLKLPDNFDATSADGSLAFWLTAGYNAYKEAQWDKISPEKAGVISGHVILPSSAMAEAAANLYLKEATRHWDEKPQTNAPPQNAFKLMGYSARLLSESLGFSGAAYTLDAACASSLYAIHLASEELLSGRLEAVITGGVAKADALFTQLGFSQLKALSSSGYLSPFDEKADGLVVGEGAVALVLKRLDLALAHGDHIRALIRGIGLSNDQSGNILAPQAEGQLRAMKSAWFNAGLNPQDLDLIEAHGTGTILGDRVEVQTLKQLLSDGDFEKTSVKTKRLPPVVGSVKSNIGHLLSAAGAASMAKVILALEKQSLPPTAGFEKEAPGLDLSMTPALRVITEAETWPKPEGGRARLAAVNAFGFGGVNAQIIVEEFLPEKWARSKSKSTTIKKSDCTIRLLSARALSAPWPDFASLAQNWMEPEGPPIISTRRFGSLKATGLFFNSLVLEGASLRLAPKDLAHILPQQALALKVTEEALASARLDSAHGLPSITAISDGENLGIDKSRIGVFMGVDIDPRSADYAFRWLAPLRAAEFLINSGKLAPRDLPEFVEELRRYCPPHLTASRVIGALGSLVASRVARFIGSGGPAFTISDGEASGLRALKLAMAAIRRGEIDLALAGMVDTMGDPKTAALQPSRLWEEGAAMLVLASEKAAFALKRDEAPVLSETLDLGGRLGGLGGLFPIVKNSFFISHRLTSRGLGAGLTYWIKNTTEAPRRLESPGFAISERGGEDISSPVYSYEDATWFLVRSQSKKNSLDLLDRLEIMAKEAANDHSLMEVLGPLRAEKRALKRLGDLFWAEYGNVSGARPALAILARGFDDLLTLIKNARATLRGNKKALLPDQKKRVIWALEEDRVQGDLAWVFPGSGSHYQGMGRKLAMSFPQIMSKLENGVSYLADHFQSSAFWGQSSREISSLQAILGQVSFGILGAEVLKKFKIMPKAVIGYSLGETTALLATGAWQDREEIYNDLIRSTLFTKDLAGDLTAARRYFNWPEDKNLKWLTGVIPRSAEEVNSAIEKLPKHLRGRVFLLLLNTPSEVIVGGDETAVKSLNHTLGSLMCPLEAVTTVHNPVVTLVADKYEAFHTRETNPPPNLRYYSAAWAKAYKPSKENTAKSLLDQAVSGHDFTALINQAYDDGVRFFVEVGPGASASRMINSILKGRSHLASSLALNAADEGCLGLHRLLVELWMAGFPLKMSVLYPDASESSMKLPVPISLAPMAEMWPEADEIISLAKKDQEASVVERNLEKTTILKESTISTKALALDDVKVKKEFYEAEDNINGEKAINSLSTQDVSELKTLRRNNTPSEIDNKSLGSEIKAKPASQMGTKKEKSPFDLWLAKAREEKIEEKSAIKDNKPAPLSREQCLEFAIGRISNVFGERFKEVDNFPSRVRLPDEPLMLVDRVSELEGEPLSMKKGRIVTEHDIQPGSWYLDHGSIPTGLAIESGQADLMLSAWLGADFATKGLALYRLLDAEVTFHRELPKAGETARYDIRISRFFKYSQTHLFRFEFEATIAGQALLSMKGGCAGYFTPSELAGGRGLPGGGLLDEASETFIDPEAIKFRENLPSSLNEKQLEALRSGDLKKAFGPDFNPNVKKPLTLPKGQMGLISRVSKIDKNGGRYGAGFIRAEMDIDPKAWFLTCHFLGDEVMPGTLMYEGCLHALRTYLTALGWVGEVELNSWQPVVGVPASLKCRGQVTAKCTTAAYEVHIRRLEFKKTADCPEGEAVAEAEAIMLADNRPIVEVRNLNLRLAGSSKKQLEKIWASKQKIRTEESQVFTKDQLLAFAQGRPSQGLGPAYARFDSGDFVARLPRPPYDFIDKVTVKCGKQYEIINASEIQASYTPPDGSWLFTEAGGAKPALPYAALNEIALQPCGFLAAFMGSALPFDGPMHFRNLGGEAQTLAPVYGGQEIISTVSLSRSSRMGDILIQHYDFSCAVSGKTVYEGKTHFGFFSPDALAQQAGLGENMALWPQQPPSLEAYPEAGLWPGGRWRMISKYSIDLKGGEYSLGSAFAINSVDPKAWFFKAHFHQDPVWPGSLGLEAFLQVLKAFAVKRFNINEEDAVWVSPQAKAKHQWLYRGQITPEHKEMSLSLLVKELDENSRSICADGILMVDGLPIYKMTGFTVGIKKALASSSTKAAKKNYSKKSKKEEEGISPQQLLNWRKEKGFSQGQLAKIMGVTPIYISLLERGKRNISPLMAEKLNIIFSGEPNSPADLSALDSELLSKGSLKNRRKEKETALRLLSPEKLKKLRTDKGLSQKKLAEQVGVTATLIGLIELGKRSLSLPLAHKLLAVLEEK